MGLLNIVKCGVVTGADVKKVFDYAKENNFAIPAINVIGSESINAVLEAASHVKAPVIIQFSNGGSGSELSDIRDAISFGVVKMNLDTDIQWAFWDGVRAYEKENHEYLQSQIGNPNGEDSPNKKYYDPRKWLRAGQESMVKRAISAFENLNCTNRL